MKRDFKNYDYLTISVKSEQIDRILECYSALGWREIKREDDREYYDMKYIALRRPHKIENKDRLQLLQVRMETNVNAVSSINARKHAKSIAALSVLLVLALGLLASGLWLILGLKGGFGTLTGAISCGVAGALAIAAAVTVTVARKPEERAAAKKIAETMLTIQSLVSEARSLAPSEAACDTPVYGQMLESSAQGAEESAESGNDDTPVAQDGAGVSAEAY